jgi:hypothetical protein
MKKVIVSLMAISLLALAIPALALPPGPPSSDKCCDVHFDVDVDKDVTITKDVTIDKYFTFFVAACIDPKAIAECDVWKCDYNANNVANLQLALFDDKICDSFKNFVGIGQANQAAGYMNNQGNIVAAALVQANEVAAMTEVGVDQENYSNCLTASFTFSFDSISGSFNRFEGIGQANQSAGSMNNQNNVVAISAGLADSSSGWCGSYGSKDLVATNDTFLTQANTEGHVQACGVVTANSVSGSFNGFEGIGQVNQSAGSLNNQANIVSIAYVGPRP